MRTVLWLGLALAVGLLLPGCVSMKAVQDYSAASHKTLEGVQSVGKDYGASCERANRFLSFAKPNNCSIENENAKGIQAAAGVLDAYVVALGVLAADELVKYNTEMDGLVKQVEASKVMNDTRKVEAFGALASFIAAKLTSLYQQEKVAEYLGRGNAAMGNATEALAFVVERNYPGVIANELGLWSRNLAELEKTEKPKNLLQWDSFVSAQWQVRADLLAKQTAAQALAKSVRAIGRTHAALNADAKHLTGKEVVAAVRDFVAGVEPVLKEVQDAYAKK